MNYGHIPVSQQSSSLTSLSAFGAIPNVQLPSGAAVGASLYPAAAYGLTTAGTRLPVVSSQLNQQAFAAGTPFYQNAVSPLLSGSAFAPNAPAPHSSYATAAHIVASLSGLQQQAPMQSGATQAQLNSLLSAYGLSAGTSAPQATTVSSSSTLVSKKRHTSSSKASSPPVVLPIIEKKKGESHSRDRDRRGRERERERDLKKRRTPSRDRDHRHRTDRGSHSHSHRNERSDKDKDRRRPSTTRWSNEKAGKSTLLPGGIPAEFEADVRRMQREEILVKNRREQEIMQREKEERVKEVRAMQEAEEKRKREEDLKREDRRMMEEMIRQEERAKKELKTEMERSQRKHNEERRRGRKRGRPDLPVMQAMQEDYAIRLAEMKKAEEMSRLTELEQLRRQEEDILRDIRASKRSVVRNAHTEQLEREKELRQLRHEQRYGKKRGAAQSRSPSRSPHFSRESSSDSYELKMKVEEQQRLLAAEEARRGAREHHSQAQGRPREREKEHQRRPRSRRSRSRSPHMSSSGKNSMHLVPAQFGAASHSLPHPMMHAGVLGLPHQLDLLQVDQRLLEVQAQALELERREAELRQKELELQFMHEREMRKRHPDRLDFVPEPLPHYTESHHQNRHHGDGHHSLSSSHRHHQSSSSRRY